MTSILRFPAKKGAGLLHVDDLLAAGVTSVLEDCCAQLCKKYTISVQWILLFRSGSRVEVGATR